MEGQREEGTICGDGTWCIRLGVLLVPCHIIVPSTQQSDTVQQDTAAGRRVKTYGQLTRSSTRHRRDQTRIYLAPLFLHLHTEEQQ